METVSYLVSRKKGGGSQDKERAAVTGYGNMP